ncbi:MAG: ribonuclease R [Hyphomicrobiaceae bacterium]
MMPPKGGSAGAGPEASVAPSRIARVARKDRPKAEGKGSETRTGRARGGKGSTGRAAPRSKPRRLAGADGTLPTREAILDFLRSSEGRAGKREIARAFAIKGDARVALKRLIEEMTEEGLISGNRKEFRERGGLPPVAVLEIVASTSDGDLVAEPVVWDAREGERPVVLVVSGRAGNETRALATGDRILARISALTDADVEGFRFEAEPIKRLPREKQRLVGIFRANARHGGGTIQPVDRKMLKDWPVAKGNEGKARDGDLVRFDIVGRGRIGVPEARIAEVLGNPQDQRQISLIAVHAHGIPDEFPEGVLDELTSLAAPTLKGREDLRDLPLVTIDPSDARDHDDAVHAAPDPDPQNAGGWIVTVAIADVAHYVRPGTRLDAEAQKRGNSVYFPDRVVPMLPERISNDLCSLREGEERPCLAMRMVFDRSGTKRRSTVLRGLMRSRAKLAYEQAQAAIDGRPDDKTGPILEPILKPLWACYAALSKARDRRGPLDLDLPERRILLGADGRVRDVVVPERLAAHRLIEEFMIQANVAAAELLEAKATPLVYRVHEPPSKEKLKALQDFLASLELKLPPAGNLKPADFNRVLAEAAQLPVADLVNEVVLRSQSQAVYSPESLGHFGLHLSRYAHFTSPIRRYADLVVHRALIRAYRLGPGGIEDHEIADLQRTSETISQLERRAMAAERETIDRLIAAHLADRVGASFKARISGVTRSGLFVRLDDTGADGFVPGSALSGDYFQHVEQAHALVGQRTGLAYRLGDRVEVRLVEAIPSAGALRFEMLSEPVKGGLAMAKGHRPGRGRGLKPKRRPRPRRR